MSTSKSRKPSSAPLGPPPTDMELMRYADGELDEGRRREVEAHVARDAGRRAKIAGLEIVAEAIRERALSSPLADGIADAVMGRIERGEAGAPAKMENGAGARRISVSDLPGAKASPARKGAAPFEKKPANDNARGIFALAALAAAAAAAMMIWGRMESEPPRATLTQPAPTETAAAPPAEAPEPVAAAPGEGEAKPGVEVAAVDFGARMGTIFYVPAGSAASSATTTVVWLSDNGTGGE